MSDKTFYIAILLAILIIPVTMFYMGNSREMHKCEINYSHQSCINMLR